MIVRLSAPSPMDAKANSTTVVKEPSLLSELVPRRYSKSQRKVNLYPFQVMQTDGQLADQGYIVLDIRTGKLAIEHRLEEVPVEMEKKNG